MPAFAGSVKTRFKVEASGGTTLIQGGDSVELTLSLDSFKAVDRICPPMNSDGTRVCEDFTIELKPSNVVEVVAGPASRFLSIAWTADGPKARFAFLADEKDYLLILSFLEQSSGRKAVNADAQTADRPRVLLRSQSYGTQGALRDQSMEMATDLRKKCPIALVTINTETADFTVLLNHIEAGVLVRDNQFQVYNKDGDLVSGWEGGSIMGSVRSVCALITTEWAAHRQ
jgi:hypothetical protein